MDHEQVRSWILDAQAMDATKARLAADHLASCADCQAFAARWRQTRLALEMRPSVSPTAGFTGRWFERLVAARQRRHRRQLILALCLLAIGTSATFGVMAWAVLGSPAAAAGVILGQVASLTAQIQAIGDSVRIVADLLPPFASLGLVWAAAAAALGFITLYTGFSALWTASVYRAVLKTRNKEN